MDGEWVIQEEDGIRDDLVTGVQTCALPICRNEEKGGVKKRPQIIDHRHAHEYLPWRAGRAEREEEGHEETDEANNLIQIATPGREEQVQRRSEERRVGKEGRYGWGVGDSRRRRHTR